MRILSLIILALSLASCNKITNYQDIMTETQDNNIIEVYHIIRIRNSDIMISRGLSRDIAPTSVVYGTKQKYIGKITLFKDGSFDVKCLEDANQQGWERVMYADLKSKRQDFKGKEENFIGYFNQYLEERFSRLPTRTIKSEVGEKYLKNGWTKSRGSELRDAIIHLDKFPAYFVD